VRCRGTRARSLGICTPRTPHNGVRRHAGGWACGPPPAHPPSHRDPACTPRTTHARTPRTPRRDAHAPRRSDPLGRRPRRRHPRTHTSKSHATSTGGPSSAAKSPATPTRTTRREIFCFSSTLRTPAVGNVSLPTVFRGQQIEPDPRPLGLSLTQRWGIASDPAGGFSMWRSTLDPGGERFLWTGFGRIVNRDLHQREACWAGGYPLPGVSRDQ
jgi:hypothetical protein